MYTLILGKQESS